LGPLTEVSELHATAELFWRRQSVQVVAPGFPDRAPGADAPVPPHRATAAERHRQRGIRLIEAGRPAAAIAAFNQATRFDPRNAAAYRALGHALLDEGRTAEAVDSLRLATALEDDAAAYHNLAVALRRLRFNGEAMAAYRRATELAPSLVEAHIGLADLLEQAGEDEEAAQSLRAAAAVAPDTPIGRLCSGRAAMLERDFARAETELRKGTELDPQDDGLIKNLGDVLARVGRFSDALAAFDHAIALNPWQFTAHFAAIEAKKCTERDRPRLTQIRALLSEPWVDDDDRVLLHFAAGKLLDDLGEYAEAMQHYESGNQVRGRYTAFSRAGFTADVDRLLQRYTPGFFAANREFGTDDETPLLIVGLPRSGTTLVEQILSRHPQIGAGGEQPFWIRRSAASGTLEMRNGPPPECLAG
jgi:tetratricopeptide (TPR) repeat protein